MLINAVFTAPTVLARAQSPLFTESPSTTSTSIASGQQDPAYSRPSQRTMLSNYVFDAYGPYPLTGAAITAGADQLNSAPREWGQGAGAFGERFGSDLAIAAIGTTTRYGLAEAFREDTLYYRCACRGLFPRIGHAVVSTLTARRGEDGHRVFSLAAIAAPYAGTMAAVYGWYPDRYDARDAFRMGNYGLLAYAGENIALEFFYIGPRSLLTRLHMNNTHASPIQGLNR